MAKTLRQSKGGRKTAKFDIPKDRDARLVVQWFYKHHSQNVSELSRTLKLPPDFCRTWAKRDSIDVVYKGSRKRGPVPIIQDDDLSPLKRKVLKVRFSQDTFMQDGARGHTSNSTESWLEDNLPAHWTFTPRYSWPPNSPDLNIIENVWAILQDMVIEDLAFDENKLIECIERAWWALPQSTIQELYHDMPRRINDTLKKQGGRIPRMK